MQQSEERAEREKIGMRYSRQELLKEIGIRGQKILQETNLAVVGLGAIGSVATELSVRAGIGKLTLIDRDLVEESNLQRQMLFIENYVGKSKAEMARKRLEEINSKIKVESKAIHLNSQNIFSLLKEKNLILDCTDNLQTRFLLNDFCKKNKIPLIYAAAIKTSGYVFPVLPEGPCLGCFLREASLETCGTAGVLNTITTSIAAQQVTLALKILLGKKVIPELHHTDIWNAEFKMMQVKKNKDCRPCRGVYAYLEKKEETRLIKFCGSGRFQVMGVKHNFEELKKRWEKIGEVIAYEGTLSFKNILLFKDGRALINADSEEEALAAYSKWAGN